MKHSPHTDIKSDYWLFRLLPRWAVPYGMMARWDRPIGWWLLLLPTWWGLILGAGEQGHDTRVLWYAVLFWIGAVAMRGAGCVWNDITDRHLDGSVERTQNRPLPAGLITVRQAVIFMAVQCAVGVWVLTHLPVYAVVVAVSSVALVGVYPYMKRITYFPQVVLGLAFNWGVWVGYTAMGHTLNWQLANTWAVACVYGAGVFWTVAYDTIYALQDTADDKQIGIKSTAIKFESNPHMFIGLCYGMVVVLIAGALWLMQSGSMAYVGLGALALQFLGFVMTLNPTSPDHNLRQFKSNKLSGILVLCILVVAGV